jgi:hypothetical protein
MQQQQQQQLLRETTVTIGGTNGVGGVSTSSAPSTNAIVTSFGAMSSGHWAELGQNKTGDSLLTPSASFWGRSVLIAKKDGETTVTAGARAVGAADVERDAVSVHSDRRRGTIPPLARKRSKQGFDIDEDDDDKVPLVDEEEDGKEDRRGEGAGGRANQSGSGGAAETPSSPSLFGSGSLRDQRDYSGDERYDHVPEPSESMEIQMEAMLHGLEKKRNELEKMRTENAILLERLAVAGDATSSAAAMDDDFDGVLYEGGGHLLHQPEY